MNRILAATAAPLALAALTILPMATTAQAQPSLIVAESAKTAVFAVENMTCAVCRVTVKKAMEQVKGVTSVDVDLDAQTATVVFDPAMTTIEAIAKASTNAGYPAGQQS